MTNKIMQNNSLYNINQNKILQDKLSTQMQTQQKLTRPSDDPVVAIRALRLRTSVSELTQYYEKNAPDAENWIKVTQGGLETTGSILTDLMHEANKGANKEKDVDELEIILTQMKSYAEGFYDTGNLDYGGRYVFTGYRTDTPLSFTATDVANTDKPIPSYNITEQTTIESFDLFNYTNIDNLDGITPSNYKTHTADLSGASLTEQDIKNGDIHRLRLAYDNLDGKPAPSIEYNIVKDSDGKVTSSQKMTTTVATSADAAYKQLLAANEAKSELALFVPETGEILLSDKSYEKLNAASGPKDEIRINYDKSEWQNGDLRPEHYFACTTTDKAGNKIEYNQEYLEHSLTSRPRQTISYDVGYNQRIDINTTADEVFTHTLARDMDDLTNVINSLKNIKSIKDTLSSAIKGMEEYDPDYADTKRQLDAAEKAYSYIRQSAHDMFGHAISNMQSYIDATNVAVTDSGTRESRLSLIKNRLMDQKSSFEDLQVENEGADITEVAVELTSAQLTYDASLMSTSKIMQTTLMNYI